MVGGGNFLGLLPGDLPENVRRIWSEIDPVFHVPCIAPRPLLMLNVTRDLLVPRFFAESLHKAAGDGATVIWLEADHTFRGVDREAVGQMVIEFLAENL